MRLRRPSTIAYVVVVALVVPAGFAIAGGTFRQPESKPRLEAHPESGGESPKPVESEKPKPKVSESPKPKPDTTPPKLVVTSPADGATLATKKVTFKGATEPGAKVKVGSYAASVSSSGYWSILLYLSPGANRVVFTAKDRAGNTTTRVVEVKYVPPQPKPEPKPVEFTAFQKFGSCSETPPFDVFYGSAPAGSAIKVYSEYGITYATVGETGRYEIRAEFADAPVGKTFPVYVKLYVNGEKVAYKAFSFTHTV